MLLLWILCYLCFMFVFAVLSCLFLQPCDHLLRKGWPFGSLMYFLVLCHFPIWCPGSDVVLSDSWSLLSSLLWIIGLLWHLIKQILMFPPTVTCFVWFNWLRASVWMPSIYLTFVIWMGVENWQYNRVKNSIIVNLSQIWHFLIKKHREHTNKKMYLPHNFTTKQASVLNIWIILYQILT